jgi:hypothetical protein
MKRLAFVSLAAFLFSCNSNTAETASAAKDTSTSNAAKPTYAYSIEHPDNWDIGSTANTAIALDGLKAWEKGDIDGCVKNFADTVTLQFDGPDLKLPHDSLKAFFADGYAHTKNVSIKMQDWESVISKDKKEEWVTLWYMQYFDTDKGRDSVSVINDLMIKDGKIKRLAEYTRKYH